MPRGRPTPEIRPNISSAGYDIRPLDAETVQRLAGELTESQREVILTRGTERPYCGTLLDNKLEGTYVCRLCGLPLFSSEAKFDSGSGWPSFFQPVDPDHVATIEDRSHGMRRTEIVCARCGGHLGHVFDDGPAPTGQRHCVNSESLEFHERGVALPERSRPPATETAYFAAGCFWGVEDQFQATPGVIDAASGYMGGHAPNPTYREVCAGLTGHAETVRVIFEPRRVGYRALLKLFFEMHDPTQKDRQGPDVGSQYRSAIFAASDAQLDQARSYVTELHERGAFAERSIVTQIERAGDFHLAEPEHQDFNARHGRGCAVRS